MDLFLGYFFYTIDGNIYIYIYKTYNIYFLIINEYYIYMHYIKYISTEVNIYIKYIPYIYLHIFYIYLYTLI